MARLSATSTFKDFQDLLINEDEVLKKQIMYLNSNMFAGQETDLGYLRRNFHFFMAIVLQGVSDHSSKEQNIKFLHILYPNRIENTGVSTWSANAGRFVDDTNNNLPGDLNKKLKDIPETTPLSSFIDGSWYDLKDQNGAPIFTDNGNSIFPDDKDKNGNIIKKGEERAKEKMKQIAEFLVNGKQITSVGGFSITTEPVQLLKYNMQLILNGAPGTGKTFSARNEIADKLLGQTGDKEIQMDMVQFHPSYDYTDFIEGIRPTMTVSATSGTSVSASGGNIGYTLKNGTFKKFCRRAGVIERIIASGQQVDDNNIDIFLNGEDQKIKEFWKKWYKENSNSDQDNVSKLPPLPPFLFIIDEINRAEISKVLGETMYCLDADYRGPKGKIATQYSSMATDESFFISKDNDEFFIPSNVYIIGTMNDIDRSVEVFDFALRRRFVWHEVKAKDVMETVLNEMSIDTALGQDYNDYLNRINKMNNSIETELRLSRHYHLGPSYFAKIGLYMSNGSNYSEARKEVWDNHISQILFEYVKGKKTEEKIEDIGEAFVL